MHLNMDLQVFYGQCVFECYNSNIQELSNGIVTHQILVILIYKKIVFCYNTGYMRIPIDLMQINVNPEEK